MTIDLGTGDGLFVYHAARRNPDLLCIGIDANADPLRKISEKIYRKPQRGGALNALYLLASAENLPDELNETADEVTVIFPWGSLLQALIRADERMLGGIRRICKPGARVKIVFGLDPSRDRSEVDRLALPLLTTDFLKLELPQRYAASGFQINSVAALAEEDLQALGTSWARRLRNNRTRAVYEMIARAI